MGSRRDMDHRFAERIKRIEGGTQWEPDGVLLPDRSVDRKKRSKKGEVASNAAYPLSIVLAFVLGMLTVLIARYVRFQMFGMPGGGGDVLADHLFMDAAMSSCIGFLIRMVTNMKSPIHMSAKGFGITAGVLTMHMAVHRMPDLFERLFSPDWVYQVIATTEPNGFLFFTLGG
ncbi:hypothetical protein [Actibacterium sp. 188UL27-1]|uniref:hypothetical protein n=1 Tax=Actibacterium sp. 188UL27-1 TaxID=2786961 RepID=UPI00195A96AF|nr:hypothetical protein [Actibacterium sp. 188UL27-1]MBM7067529.1 hypothetical protein [Actibacterium sp. 188UL27-1]